MNKIYWVALKSSKFNYHSRGYDKKSEAIKRLKEFDKRDRKDLSIYSIEYKF